MSRVLHELPDIQLRRMPSCQERLGDVGRQPCQSQHGGEVGVTDFRVRGERLDGRLNLGRPHTREVAMRSLQQFDDFVVGVGFVMPTLGKHQLQATFDVTEPNGRAQDERRFVIVGGLGGGGGESCYTLLLVCDRLQGVEVEMQSEVVVRDDDTTQQREDEGSSSDGGQGGPILSEVCQHIESAGEGDGGRLVDGEVLSQAGPVEQVTTKMAGHFAFEFEGRESQSLTGVSLARCGEGLRGYCQLTEARAK